MQSISIMQPIPNTTDSDILTEGSIKVGKLEFELPRMRSTFLFRTVGAPMAQTTDKDSFTPKMALHNCSLPIEDYHTDYGV